MQGGSVLVVEDDVFTRLAVGDHLRDCGYDVLEAETGHQAIALLTNGAAASTALAWFDGFASIGPTFRCWSPRVMPWRWSWPPSSATCGRRSPNPTTKARVAAAVAELLEGRNAVV